jgi:hypothetical protein
MLYGMKTLSNGGFSIHDKECVRVFTHVHDGGSQRYRSDEFNEK